VILLHRRNWLRAGAVLLTCTVLVLLLGLNVSAIGLVTIPRGSVYLVAELFGLILALNVVYMAVFIGLERKSLISRGAGQDTGSRGASNPTAE
jgi:hypothetical protein